MKVTPDDYGRRCQFDHFCKLVLYHEAVDYFRERKRQRGWETSFETLPLSELDTLSGRSNSLASQSSSRRKISILWRRTVSCGSPSPVPSPNLKVNLSPPMSHGVSAVPWKPERSASNIKSCMATARVRMVSRRSFRNRRRSSDPTFTEYIMSTHPSTEKRIARLEKLL